jgi:hypothetical protein
MLCIYAWDKLKSLTPRQAAIEAVTRPGVRVVSCGSD